MKKIVVLAIALLAQHALSNDEAWATRFELGELESRQQSGANPLAWDAGLLIGNSTHELRILSEGERNQGEIEGHELRLQYARAISAAWDVKLGLRKDTGAQPNREWLEVGVEGQIAYAVDAAVSAFFGEDDRSGLRVELEKEMNIAPRWSLVPEMTANFYGHDDFATGVGSGLSDVELAARLAYQAAPQFSVYFGGIWGRAFGQSANYARQQDEDVEGAQLVIGISGWF